MKRTFTQHFAWRFTIIVGLALVSCHDNYTLCDQSRQVSVNGRFFTRGPGGTAVSTPPASFSVTGISGNPLLTNIAAPPLFSLTLFPGSDSAKFIFKINSAPADTITYFYSTQETLLSANCGTINTFTLTNVKTTRHTIDSTSIVSPQVRHKTGQQCAIFLLIFQESFKPLKNGFYNIPSLISVHNSR